MRRYIDYEYFYSTLVDLWKEDKWHLECEDLDGEIYTLVFEKYMYEAQDGHEYPCIIYSYPFTLDAAIINYDVDEGWDLNITSVWNDITRGCDLRPFIEEQYETEFQTERTQRTRQEICRLDSNKGLDLPW